MSAGQIAASRGSLRAPIVAVLVSAFALGALTGVGLPRAASIVADLGAGTAAAPRSTVPGAALNNMSDAAAQAFAGLAAQRSTVPGAALNNMSDAAAQAFAGLADDLDH
jgi:hypothetical protein